MEQAVSEILTIKKGLLVRDTFCPLVCPFPFSVPSDTRGKGFCLPSELGGGVRLTIGNGMQACLLPAEPVPQEASRR